MPLSLQNSNNIYLIRTNNILLFCLVVLLIKNPFCIYLSLFGLYKIIYFLAIFYISCDFVYFNLKRGGVPLVNVEGVREFFLFFVASIAVVLIAYAYNQKINVLLTVQFLMNVAQYFFIVYIIFRLERPLLLIYQLYRIVTILASLALILWLFNAIGFVPIHPISIPYPLSETGVINYYFPFGIHPQKLPISTVYYRSYSYFTEPAYLAFISFPFSFFALSEFVCTRRKKHLIAFFLIFFGALTSRSLAGISAIVITAFIYSLLKLIRGRKKILNFFVLLLAIILGVLLVESIFTLTSDSPYLTKFYHQTFNRLYQWGIAFKYIKNHFIGEGIGFQKEVAVFRPDYNGKEFYYSSFTNVFSYAYYLGSIFLFPLLFFLGKISYNVIRSICFSKTRYVQTLSIMCLYMLIYNVSSQVLFAPVFLFFFGAYNLIKNNVYHSIICEIL